MIYSTRGVFQYLISLINNISFHMDLSLLFYYIGPVVQEQRGILMIAYNSLFLLYSSVLFLHIPKYFIRLRFRSIFMLKI